MTRTDIESFGKEITKYAFYRMIFFGIALLTLMISFDLLSKLENVNIYAMTDEELTTFIGDDFFIWIGLLLLIFFLAIIGAIIFVMYVKYIIQLRKVSSTTSNPLLHNIYVSELIQPVTWIIQIFLIGGMTQSGFQQLNIVFGLISIYTIIHFKKWVDSFRDKISASSVTPLQLSLNIWMICIISFIIVSMFQGFGIFFRIIGEYNGLFLVIIECSLLLVISVVSWQFGKKIVDIF